MIIKYIFGYLMVSILISLFFGVYVVIANILLKVKEPKGIIEFIRRTVDNYWLHIFSLITLILLIIFFDLDKIIFVSRDFNLISLLALITFASFSTSLFCTVRSKQLFKEEVGFQKMMNNIKVSSVNGMLMEIPMRLLVQNCFYLLGLNQVIYSGLTSATILTGIIWVQFIVVQMIIMNEKVTRGHVTEMIASFWFSIWVGIIYYVSGNIMFPMIAHGLQRIFAELLVLKKFPNYREVKS